jgi:hypothetical protein
MVSVFSSPVDPVFAGSSDVEQAVRARTATMPTAAGALRCNMRVFLSMGQGGG